MSASWHSYDALSEKAAFVLCRRAFWSDETIVSTRDVATITLMIRYCGIIEWLPSAEVA